jgi:hypothetical protein
MSEKNIKTIEFSGIREGYNMWEFKMPAYLREIGCATPLFRSNMLAAVNDEDERKKNYKAYSRLVMAMKMDDVVGSQIVKRSRQPRVPRWGCCGRLESPSESI